MIRLVEERLFIDGYLDVVSINEDTIIFAYKGYELEIQGNLLKVVSYSKSEMIIHGLLRSILFHYDKEK